jgi:hypothetical protein
MLVSPSFDHAQADITKIGQHAEDPLSLTSMEIAGEMRPQSQYGGASTAAFCLSELAEEQVVF